MKFDIDDARLTAYLLGELDAAERAEVEELLAEDAEARAFVESMGGVTEALQAELSTTEASSMELGDLRRARIAKAATGARSKRWIVVGGVAAAAAAVALMMVTVKGEKSEPASHFQSSVSTEGVAKDSRSNSIAAVTPPHSGTIPSGATVTETTAGDTAATDTSTATAHPNSVLPPAPQTATATPVPTTTGLASLHGRKGRPGPARGDNKATRSSDAYDTAVLDPQTRRQLESLGYFGGEDEDIGYYSAPEPIVENGFVAVAAEPLSTFSIDVDTASYSQMRQSLRAGRMPAPSSVRIEELINYFDYTYPSPARGEPFAAVTEVSGAPWNTKHKLVRIGIKARDVVQDRRPRANLVFLLDVSGSMSSEDKLPLLKRSLAMLLTKLDAEDRIAIVVYAGASGLALPSTSVAKQSKILGAFKRLKSGGSTNGSAGIELAYQIAQENFVEGGINRVILATDGDFNVGTTSRPELVKLIEAKAAKDVFLTVLGFGMTHFSDGTMEQLADRGNGNYAFIDTLAEAKKVLVDEVQSTLVAVAKDVKIQIEFNPKRVSQYRLIGYENRVLANEDFNNDAKDAGEIGAGHTVTALYEIVPPSAAKVDSLRYQTATTASVAADSGELLTLKLRYKEPTGHVSRKKEIPVLDSEGTFGASSVDFKFASAVAAFGMILRGSSHSNGATLSQVLDWASEGRGRDVHEYRAEFLQLIRKAIRLQR